jgi:hypothetical protein
MKPAMGARRQARARHRRSAHFTDLDLLHRRLPQQDFLGRRPVIEGELHDGTMQAGLFRSAVENARNHQDRQKNEERRTEQHADYTKLYDGLTYTPTHNGPHSLISRYMNLLLTTSNYACRDNFGACIP